MARQDDKMFVATTSLGLAGVLEEELVGLRASAVRRFAGGATFRGDRDFMMEACMRLRTAHRVRWVLGTFQVHAQDDLYEGVRQLARWQGLVPATHTLAVDASVRDAVFLDGRFAALRVKDAIVDAVRDATGNRPSVDRESPDVGVHLRLTGKHATISLDAAGSSLHERGYRRAAGVAPLRETLAAGVILLSGWPGNVPLVDPMCGSGTLVIEAAMLAAGIAPGLDRSFGFERWPGHRPQRLERIREEVRASVVDVEIPIVGRDHDEKVVLAAQRNAERAGVVDLIRFERVPFDQGRAPCEQPGLVVANPPYGHRLGDVKRAEATHSRLGAALRAGFGGWRAVILTAHESHRQALGLEEARTWPLKNGALDVNLFGTHLP